MAEKILGLLASAMLTTTPSTIYKPASTRWATVNVTVENQESVTVPKLFFALVPSSYVSGVPDSQYIRESGNEIRVDSPIVLTGMPIGPEQAVVAWLSETANVSMAVDGIEEDR